LPIVFLGIVLSAHAQVVTEVPMPAPDAKPVTVENVKVHSPSLVGNPEGDAVDREAIVFLPPAYATCRNKRIR